MTIAGGFPLDHGYGGKATLRSDGRWVLDVSGQFLGREDLPRYRVCPVDAIPVFIGTFAIDEIPLLPESGDFRCRDGHKTVAPDYFNLTTSVRVGSGDRPRVLHVRRPTETYLLGHGWLLKEQADDLLAGTRLTVLLAAAHDAAVGKDASGRLARALKDAPEPVRRLRKEKMSRADWIALGALVVSIIGTAFTTVGIVHDLTQVDPPVLIQIVDRCVAQSGYQLDPKVSE